ncbi:MAG: hypothetical protein QM504_02810, partial [Pseudomonadota bacterium]
MGLILEDAKAASGCQIKQIIPFSPVWNNNTNKQIEVGDKLINVNTSIDSNSTKILSCQQIIDKIKILTSLTTTEQIQLSIISRHKSSKERNKEVTINLKEENIQKFLLNGFKNSPVEVKEMSKMSLQSVNIYHSLNVAQINHSLNKTDKKELYSSFQHLDDKLFVPRLSLVASIQNQPDKVIEYLIQLSDTFLHNNQTHTSTTIIHWLNACKIILQCSSEISTNKIPQHINNTHHNKNLHGDLLAILKQTSENLSLAFKLLSTKEKQFFIHHVNSLHGSLSTGELLALDSNIKRKNTNIRLFSIASKINYQQLNKSFSYLLALINPQLMHQYKALHNEKTLLFATPYGDIIFGTTGDDKHVVKPGSLIIDPAGNDTYLPQQHSRQDNYLKSTIIIDLAGNDHYLAPTDPLTPFGISGAILGLSLLVDKNGDDQYDGSYWSQGSAFAGIALHYDENGNDSYHADALSQAT